MAEGLYSSWYNQDFLELSQSEEDRKVEAAVSYGCLVMGCHWQNLHEGLPLMPDIWISKLGKKKAKSIGNHPVVSMINRKEKIER